MQVKANEPLRIGPVKLGLPDGRLAVRSRPAGASVTIGGAYRGRTPLEVDVRPDLQHVVSVTREVVSRHCSGQSFLILRKEANQ